MKPILDRIESVQQIPPEWDDLVPEYFQQREFLSHCESFNPCSQRYYVLSSGGQVHAGAIVYTLRIDLLAFLGIRSPVKMSIVGVPCSVSSSGVVGRQTNELIRQVLRVEKGLVAFLNLDAAPEGLPVAVGRTWSDMTVFNRFGSWDEYCRHLRSSYRRRLHRIETYCSELTVEQECCSSFSTEMHRMYLEVFRRSEGKLEKLPLRFFKHLPDSFHLTTYKCNGRIHGWTITQCQGARFSFFLGGQDYRLRPRRLYLVQLMTVIREGIESGARIIDLGQSAEIPKMRMGGVPRKKIMLGHHSNRVFQRMLDGGIGILSYRKRFPDAHVFKEAMA